MGSRGRPYRTFVAPGYEAYEILVGKGERDNDHLTFDVAEPHDLWLHVGGGTAGSHVVIKKTQARSDSDDPDVVPLAVLERAAALAAWYSKARGASSVEVHYCKANQVSKPRGAPAGLVELARWQSIRVKPEG